MAGTIIMRKERDGYFYATPMFTCPGMRFDAPKPVGKGRTPELALVCLVPLMPFDYQAEMNSLDRWDFYDAPERINIADKCVDMDRHRPTMEERVIRRRRFLTEVRLGHVQSSWDLTELKEI